MSDKVKVDLQDLKELAVLARKNGTTDAFITLALQWAEMANAEIVKLRTAIAIKETECGCWCDLEPDSEPDGCVLDDNMPEDCVYARQLVKQGLGKTACKYWKPLI